LNDFSDNVYVVIRLPAGMAMKTYDRILIDLFPATGMATSILLEAPFSMSRIITFQ
jgi:hypothetical protein